MEKVIVRCFPNGNTEVEGQGIKGTSCTLKTQPIAWALGQIVATRPTAEMFEETNQAAQQEEIQQ